MSQTQLRRIIIVSEADTCRSVALAAVLRKVLLELKDTRHIEVRSAALSLADLGQPADPLIVANMRLECGIDLSGHRSCHIDEYAPIEADLIVCLDAESVRTLRDTYPSRVMLAKGEGGLLDIRIPYGVGGVGFATMILDIEEAAPEIIEEFFK